MACVTLALLTPLAVHPADSEPFSFKLIVHPATEGGRLPREVVSSIFLGQVTAWGDGSPIKVLDRSLTSPLRVAFGNRILGMTTLEVGQYWRRQMARGKVPPSIQESEDAVLAFVASNPGSIAYVAVETPTPPTVKIVEID